MGALSFNFKKKQNTATRLLLAIASAGVASVSASSSPKMYIQSNVNQVTKASVAEWVISGYTYGTWSNSGSPTNCSSWGPNPSTIAWGTEFIQTRTCQQIQTRTKTEILLNTLTQKTKPGATSSDTRTINISQSQPSTGLQDFITGEEPQSWSNWLNIADHYDCGNWTPLPEDQNLLEEFTQTRPCSQNQQRTRDVLNTWASGTKTPLRIDTEQQTISELEHQQAIGQKDFIAGESLGEWSAWSDIGNTFDCSSWSPLESDVDFGTAFTQTRSCSQNQTAHRTVNNLWRSGRETFNRSESKSQTVSTTETQPKVGTYQNWQPTTPSFTEWVDDGAHTDIGQWSPSVLAQESNFTQTRTYKQPQRRERQEREFDSVTKTYRNVGTPATETRLVDSSEERNVTAVSGAWNDTATERCSAWLPTPLEQTVTFTQTQTCDQIQSRTWTYSADGQSIGTSTQSQTVPNGHVDTRQVTVSWSAWVNTGTTANHSAWAPALADQKTNFTQTQTYSQPQTRDRVYSSGETFEENQTVTLTGSRNVVATAGSWVNTTTSNCGTWSPTPPMLTQTEDFVQTQTCDQNRTRTWDYKVDGSSIGTSTETDIVVGGATNTRTITVIVSAWSNTTTSNCAAWTPAPTTQTSEFTQTQTCDQNQIKSVTYKTPDGNTLRTSNIGRTLTGGFVDSRVVTVSWSAWSDDGEASGFSGWSPVISNQQTDFTQTQSYTQPQTRNRIYSSGETFVESQNSTSTQSRTVNVSIGAWSTAGQSPTNCGAWTPAPSVESANFWQTQVCDQPQIRDFTYLVGGAQVGTYRDSRVVAGGTTNTRLVTVEWTAWSNSGPNINYTAWSPAISNQSSGFTQSQTYEHQQTRQRKYSSGESFNETRMQTETDYRWVAASFSGWSDTTKSSCGTWSPAPSTQTNTFTQTQTCDQNQTGTWTYTSNGSNVGSRIEDRTLTSGGTNSRPVTVSWSPWINSGSGSGYSAWTPTLADQRTNFTQSQTYSQPQARNRQYSTGDSFPESQSIQLTSSRTVVATAGAWVYTTKDNCGAWSPAPSTQTSTFTQSQTCNQNQQRTWTYTADGVTIGSSTETGVIPGGASNSQQVTVSWSPWINSGPASNYSAWSPAVSNQTSNFIQTQTYSQPQARDRQYSTGVSFPEAQTVTLSGSRTVVASVGGWVTQWLQNCTEWSPTATSQSTTFTQTRSCGEKQDRLWTYTADGSNIGSYTQSQLTAYTATDSRPVTVSWTGWSNYGDVFNCSAWSPAPSSVNYGQSYTQTRSCLQAQTRTRSYSSGESYSEGQNVSVSQAQPATGTYQNWVATGPECGAWSYGSYNYSAWSPTPTTETWNFTQTRSWSRPMSRTCTPREYDTVTGSFRPSGANYTENSSESGTDSQVVYVWWDSWVNSGEPYSCSGWTPSPASVNYGTSFTQSETCTQTKARWRIYSTGHSYLEYTTQQITKTQTATGTYQNWVATGPECGAWSYGSYSYGAWSPTPTTETWNFTQTRSWSRPMSRTCTPREYDTVTGSFRYSGSGYTENSSESGTDSQVVYVWWSSWADSGQPYSCSGFTPDPSTVDYGTQFTQSESCTQGMTRSRIYSTGHVYGESTTRQLTLTQLATGTKAVITGQSFGPWSEWINIGSTYNCGSWSPATNQVTSGLSFEQTATCSQNQQQSRIVYDVWSNGNTTQKTTETSSRTISATQTQQAIGTAPYAGRWVFVGCGGGMICDVNPQTPGTGAECGPIGSTYNEYINGSNKLGGYFIFECRTVSGDEI